MTDHHLNDNDLPFPTEEELKQHRVPREFPARETMPDFRDRPEFSLEGRSVKIWMPPGLSELSIGGFQRELASRISELLAGDFKGPARKVGELKQEWESDLFLVTLWPRVEADNLAGKRTHYQVLSIQTKNIEAVSHIAALARRLFNALAGAHELTSLDERGQDHPFALLP